MGLIRNILKRKRSGRDEPVVDAKRNRCVFHGDDEHPFFVIFGNHASLHGGQNACSKLAGRRGSIACNENYFAT